MKLVGKEMKFPASLDFWVEYRINRLLPFKLSSVEITFEMYEAPSYMKILSLLSDCQNLFC